MVRRAAKGFTLIEVLVVVAIIALLVSILLPSLSRAREQARRVTCSTNLRTLHQATLYYLHDNMDAFPYEGTRRPGGGAAYGAQPFELVHKYVHKGTPPQFRDWSKCPRINPPNPSVFYCALEWYLCPKDQYYHTTSQTAPRLFPDGTTKTVEYMISYGYATDMMYVRNDTGTELTHSHKSASIKRQSTSVLYPEYGNDDCNGAGPWELRDRNDVNNQIDFPVRHLGGLNVAYVDGHIQFHKLLMNDLDTLGRNQYGLPMYPMAWIFNRTDPEVAGWNGRLPPRP